MRAKSQQTINKAVASEVNASLANATRPKPEMAKSKNEWDRVYYRNYTRISKEIRAGYGLIDTASNLFLELFIRESARKIANRVTNQTK